MVFVDLMLKDGDVIFKDFYVTTKDIVKVTGLSPQSVSKNLSVCVKDGFLRKEEFFTGQGRVVRYYVNNNELVTFVERFLR